MRGGGGRFWGFGGGLEFGDVCGLDFSGSRSGRRDGSWSGGDWGGSWGLWLGRGRSAGGLSDGSDDIADFDIFPFTFEDGQGAGGFGGDFGGDFIGLESEEDVTDFDSVSGFEVPFGDLTTCDGLAEGWDFDFCGHEGWRGGMKRGGGGRWRGN